MYYNILKQYNKDILIGNNVIISLGVKGSVYICMMMDPI